MRLNNINFMWVIWGTIGNTQHSVTEVMVTLQALTSVKVK